MPFWKSLPDILRRMDFPMRAVTVCLLLALRGAVSDAATLPTYEKVRDGYRASDALLLDRSGKVLNAVRINPGVRRLAWTSLPDVSPALLQAVIAAEDRRFYAHSGVDTAALFSAAVSGLFSGHLRGASTITMQLASFLDRDLAAGRGRRSFLQKWHQIQAALAMERSWRKNEILEAYLNLTYFYGEFQGVSAASRGMYGKYPHGLDRAESLVLATLIRSPNASADQLIRRADRLNDALDWKIPKMQIREKIDRALTGPHFLAIDANLAPHVGRRLLKNGRDAVVSCTLDADLQRFAEESLAQHLLALESRHVGEAALLVVENRTGAVRAYATRTLDPARSRFVDGVIAKRQAGSTLKPFLYGKAIEQRLLTPASLLDDGPLDVPIAGGGIYQPSNYDHGHRGLVTVREALASSLNIPAVRAAEMLGEDAFVQTLRDLGIGQLNESGDFYGPSLALGSADVTLWELVNAYRTLANNGNWSPLKLREQVRTSETEMRRIFSHETAFIISDILSDRQARSLTFGLENALATRFWTAVKTGTSKDMRDNWCAGYSRSYTVGVWVGNFSGEPMWNVSGMTGAAPLWMEMMNRLHGWNDAGEESPPEGIVRCRIQLPDSGGSGREEWFIRGTEPAGPELQTANSLPHIVYPPAGAIFAVDADIPRNRQRIFFTMDGRMNGLSWIMDGKALAGMDAPASWQPSAGRHELQLCDQNGAVLDSVQFQVRGSMKSD